MGPDDLPVLGPSRISERTTADYTRNGLDDRAGRSTTTSYLLERRRGHLRLQTARWPRSTEHGPCVADGAARVSPSRKSHTRQPRSKRRCAGRCCRSSRMSATRRRPGQVTRARLLESPGSLAQGSIRPSRVSMVGRDSRGRSLLLSAGAHRRPSRCSRRCAVRIGGAGAKRDLLVCTGVWRCTNPTCNNLFTWEPSRPCPRCGTPRRASVREPRSAGPRGA